MNNAVERKITEELANGRHSLFEFFAIALPALIIVVEIYTLSRMIREQKERKETTNALQSFRAALGRQNYMDQIALAISNARKDVVFTTATMEASWHSKEQQKIFDAVVQRFKQSKQEQGEIKNHDPDKTDLKPPYRHRGIVAQRPETLPGVIELLCFTEIELRMHPVMAMSRLRFLVQDNERSVLGIAESARDRFADSPLVTMPSVEPSKLSFSIDSTMLALALRWKFDELWQKATDPWKYLNDFISGVEPRDDSHTQLSVLNWLRVHGKNRQIIHEKLMEKCANYQQLKPIPASEIYKA